MGDQIRARLRTGLACTLPGARNTRGERTFVEPSVPIVLTAAGVDTDGTAHYQVPAGRFRPGATVHIPRLPAGAVVDVLPERNLQP